MVDLKPCPFCGMEADIMTKEQGVLGKFMYKIQCGAKRKGQYLCPCCPSTGFFLTLEEAAEAWERRYDHG